MFLHKPHIWDQKIIIPETWAKMFLANQINQPYPQNKSMK